MLHPVATRVRRYVHLVRRLGVIVGGQEEAGARADAALASECDMPLADLVQFVLRIADESPADIGFRLGASERLTDLGAAGHAITSCRTMRQAADLWMARIGEHEPLMRFQTTVLSPHWIIDFAPAARLPLRTRRLLTEEFLSAFFAFVDDVAGGAPTETVLELGYAPDGLVDYDRWLPIPPRFRSPVNRLILPVAVLDYQPPGRDDETLAILLNYFRDEPTAAGQTATRLRRLFLLDGPSVTTLASAARAFGISPRTLVRKLAAEKTSFGRVLDDHRRDYALMLARERGVGAKDIARALGFQNHQSLRRAFCKWTGMPLGRWRALHRR